ncbi:hypothetical protein MAR_025412 [Mya arenaria]|uniref:BED-type domain-containing protein n=1 Tax=Mya arenaria TaxID=6604 RepID=A0ABY7DTK5_MYAAR|nr:hypothetical protein MAR_025412 [Mya arenaria]
MSSRKSKVWSFFSKTNDKKAVCKICKAEVASSGCTTNMSTHLRRHHKINTSVTTIPTPVLKTVDQPVHQGPNPEMFSPSTSATTNTVNPWTLSRKGKLPAAINMLAALDPRYKPPSRHTIAEKSIPALVDQVKHVLQTDLDQATAVALTSDAWTSRSADSYLTITCLPEGLESRV